MGLNISVYNLRWPARVRDDRFDSTRYREDYEFVAWLNSGNAVYRHFGDPHRLDSTLYQMDIAATRQWVHEHKASEEEYRSALLQLDLLESDEMRTRLLTGEMITTNVRDLDSSAEVFERPKDVAAARAWVQEHVEASNLRKRFFDLLDLLESDGNLWIYEGW